MSETTKVIIVAQEDIHNFFAQQYAGVWDTQHVVPTINDMWAGLQNGSLSAESSIVLITDNYFTDYQQDFEVAAVSLAPNALFGVVSYDETLRPVIEERVRQLLLQTTGVDSPIYFIDANNPIQTMDEASERYFALLNGENPEFQMEETEDFAATAENAHASAPKKGQSFSNPNVDTSHNGLVIASTSSKGGSGKSTVSLMLASTFAMASKKAVEEGKAEKPLKVVVVDMDIRDGQIGFLLGQTTPTALNIRTSPDWGPETIQNNLVYDERSGIYALLAPKSGRTADDTGPDFYRHIIENLRYMFDIIILDTSVYYLDELIFDVCLPDSDAVLFVTNLSIASVYGMSRWFHEVVGPREEGGAGIDVSKIGVVVNGSVAGVGMDKRRIMMAATGAHMVGGIPLDTAAFLAAGNQNRISDMLYHKTIGPAYFDLAKRIVGKNAVLSPLVDEEDEVAPKKKNLIESAVPAGQAAQGRGKRRLFGRRG